MTMSPYDSFAWFYDRYWAPPFQEWQMPALERLSFPVLSRGAAILDLCCGTGALARRLTARGYSVIGVDSSSQMLSLARQNVPEATFLQADAADFSLDSKVDAAVCMFDSANHLIEAGQLELAFRNVWAALKPGGYFVFDINTSEAYGSRWDQSVCKVHPDHAFFLRGGFDRQTQIGTTKITMFRLFDSWQRADVEMCQKPLEVPDIERMLQATGFRGTRSYRAVEELGMSGHYGIGRVYFRTCVKTEEA